MIDISLKILILFFTFNAYGDVAIFGNQLLSQNRFGQRFIESCISTHLGANERIGLYAASGATPRSLMQNSNNSPVYGLDGYGTSLNESDRSSSSLNFYLNRVLQDKNVSPFIFMLGNNGLDETKLSQFYKMLAETMAQSNRDCIVILPPLVKMQKEHATNYNNQLIIKANQNVSDTLKGTNCKIVDPSKSLMPEDQQILFDSADSFTIINKSVGGTVERFCKEFSSVYSLSNRVNAGNTDNRILDESSSTNEASN